MQEKQALGNLAQVLSSYNRHQEKIDTLKQEMRKESDTYEKAEKKEQAANMIFERAAMWDRYTRRIEKNISEHEKSKEELRPELEKQQHGVREARRKRRVLELLRDKEKDEYSRKGLKKERKSIAEANQRLKKISTIKHILSKKERTYV